MRDQSLIEKTATENTLLRSMSLGADCAGKPIAYWQGLRYFWNTYFKRTAWTLSTTRSPVVLADPLDLGR